MKNPILKIIKYIHTDKQPAFLDIDGDDITIFMNTIQGNPSVLYATAYEDHIHINDFKTRIKGTGRGTKMMNRLIDHAKKSNIKHIDGIITEHDHTETSYIEHFYKKFGFTLTNGTEEYIKYYIKLDL